MQGARPFVLVGVTDVKTLASSMTPWKWIFNGGVLKMAHVGISGTHEQLQMLHERPLTGDFIQEDNKIRKVSGVVTTTAAR